MTIPTLQSDDAYREALRKRTSIPVFVSLLDVATGEVLDVLGAHLGQPRAVIPPPLLSRAQILGLGISLRKCDYVSGFTKTARSVSEYLVMDIIRALEQCADAVPRQKHVEAVRNAERAGYEAGITQIVPTGWQLVPVDPTNIMLDAGAAAAHDAPAKQKWLPPTWAAMLKHAPIYAKAGERKL